MFDHQGTENAAKRGVSEHQCTENVAKRGIFEHQCPERAAKRILSFFEHHCSAATFGQTRFRIKPLIQKSTLMRF